jgi:hypothetical protein
VPFVASFIAVLWFGLAPVSFPFLPVYCLGLAPVGGLKVKTFDHAGLILEVGDGMVRGR